MPGRVVAKRRIIKLARGASRRVVDHLAAEEPMEIRVDGAAVAVTMRTPGDDFDLALGFCVAEGLVDPADVESVRYCVPAGVEQTYNVVDVRRRTPQAVDEALRRNVYTTSSCGVCGTASLEAVRRHAGSVADDRVRVPADVLAGLPDVLRRSQRVFERTGGLHAAGLFTAGGQLECIREDVGRHNAVDKVVGWAARESRLPLTGTVLVVSGRVAFEIVQKAVAAGVPVIAAVSAPTSLAVSLAEDAGVTLAAFVRDGAMNLYSRADRVVG